MEELMRENFDNYYLHHFFHKTYTNAKTGILKVYFNDEITKTVYFQEGNIVFASSNANKDKLVNILLKYKKVTQDQLEVVMKQMNKNISLGRNLVNMGFITHKELIWAVKVQIIGIIHSIIVQEDGKYSFQEEDLPEGVINLPLNTLKIIFDSLILFKDKEWIATNINAPESVYKKTILFEEGKSKLLTSEELLSLADTIDGEKHVGQLSDLTDMEDFKVFKLIYALKFLNLIEEKGSEEPVVTEELFEIEDEPEENLDLIREFAGEEDDGDIKIETEDVLEADNESDESENVFIEFDVEEETSIDLTEENEEEMEENESDIETFNTSADKTPEAPTDDEFKLTEDDLDSIVLEPEEDDDDDFDSNLSVDPDLDQSEPEDQEDDDSNKTLLSKSVMIKDDSPEDLKESAISDEKGKDQESRGFLYFLIFIFVIVVCGVTYLYFFDNPIINFRKESNSVKEITGNNDVTQEEIGNLNGELNTLEKDDMQNSEQNATTDNSENNEVSPEESSTEQPALKIDTTDKTEDSAVVSNTTNNAQDEIKPEPVKQETPKVEQSIADSQSSPEVDSEFLAHIEAGKQILSSFPEKYTIRIEFACMPDTVKTAIEHLNDFENFYLIPQYRKSRTCYFVYLGVFDSEADAFTKRSQLPQLFFEGGNNPVVVKVSSVK